ncbi:MAG: 30S ribosome-binding factor RbfA, partial [Gemmatimonadaceae bacterium]|nr:30S ribosome-binding factor RbfA [Gemmatimonadaceae bacterium]
ASDVKDPRVRAALVTVTGVEVTRDLGHATVFVSILGAEADRAAVLEGLASTSSHLRARVGRALRLRVAPEIAFRYDESVARAARIETLLASVRPSEPAGDGTPSDA